MELFSIRIQRTFQLVSTFYTAEREKTAKLYFFEMIYLEMLVVRMKRIADSIIKDIEELKSEGKI